MTHTVIGLFDNKNEARVAMEELVEQGFIREHIDVSDRRYDESTTSATTNTTSDTGVGDSISNFFSSLFGDDQTTAQNYTALAQDADAILTVQVDTAERASAAAEILDRHGAIDVDERSSQYQQNQQNFSQTSGTTQNTMTDTTRNTATTTEGELSIPVIQEELQVGKREVERGGARIKSRIVEKPVEETLRLREEHIVVNRQPVNRAVTDADLQHVQEGDIELTERSEEAVVSKQARVVEEVSVGKQVSEREETVRDTVRRTDVDVEETGGITRETTDTTNTRKATS